MARISIPVQNIASMFVFVSSSPSSSPETVTALG